MYLLIVNLFLFKVKVEPQRKESLGKKTRTASVTEKSKSKSLIKGNPLVEARDMYVSFPQELNNEK